jgi:L-lactate dehydrogenase complex protein LldG
MTRAERTERFTAAARRVGAEVTVAGGVNEAATYIAERAKGTILLPSFPSGERLGLEDHLRRAGGTVAFPDRREAAGAAAGVTGANFALADTGTVALESTAEAVRLATTLPESHFVLLSPEKILPDGLAAVPLLRRFSEQQPRNYLAYITGPSRTADIERVLTIGVHGPRELHILLVEGLSDDPLEM